MYTILLVDTNECICADIYSDGEIKVIFNDRSDIPNKHKSGGQSAPRFGRLRENSIVLWYKDINEKLKSINRDIILGINFVNKNKFISKMSTYNKNKIKKIEKTEYTNLAGVYQFLERLKNSAPL